MAYSSSMLQSVVAPEYCKIFKVIVSPFVHKFGLVNLEFGFANKIYCLTERCFTQVYKRGM